MKKDLLDIPEDVLAITAIIRVLSNAKMKADVKMKWISKICEEYEADKNGSK